MSAARSKALSVAVLGNQPEYILYNMAACAYQMCAGNRMLRLLFLCCGWLGWAELGLGLQVQRLYFVAGGAGSDRTG